MFEPKPVKMIVIITDRKNGKRLTKVLNENHIHYHLAAHGRGTAPTEMQAYFGFGEQEKAVVFCVTKEDRQEDVFRVLREEMGFDNPNTGIAFSVPISSVSGMVVLKYLSGMLNFSEE